MGRLNSVYILVGSFSSLVGALLWWAIPGKEAGVDLPLRSPNGTQTKDFLPRGAPASLRLEGNQPSEAAHPSEEPVLATSPVSSERSSFSTDPGLDRPNAVTKVTAANLRFGLKLFADLSRREPNHNLVLSPSSVATALGLTYNGAAGETREAMARTLEIQNLTLPEFNRGHAALHRRMRTSEPDLRSLSANGLWVRRGVPLEPAFLRTAQEDYGAEVASLDFDDPKATEVINQWVAERTEGKISQVVGDRLGEDTLLCLMNAVYFQGQWQRPFDPTRTREGRFTLADGTVTRHPMMEQFNTFRYLEKQQFQAVNLPYGDGRLSMVLFLPRRGLDFAEFAEVLNPDSLALWMADLENAEETNVLLVLPRFQVQYEADLGGALKDLGMGLALDPMKADFRLMASSGPRVFIKRVQHKCFLTVDEKGTEAAGSTSVHMGLESAQKFHRMEVDRPFFFAIRNQETGDLLFVGSVFQPR